LISNIFPLTFNPEGLAAGMAVNLAGTHYNRA